MFALCAGNNFLTNTIRARRMHIHMQGHTDVCTHTHTHKTHTYVYVCACRMQSTMRMHIHKQHTNTLMAQANLAFYPFSVRQQRPARVIVLMDL